MHTVLTPHLPTPPPPLRYSSEVQSENGENIRIYIGTEDWVKTVSYEVGAYIVMSSEATTDLASPGNALVAVEDGSAMYRTKFVYDKTPPTLSSWTLDLEDGYIYLTFNEPVEPDSLNITKLTIAKGNTAGDLINGSYTFTTDTFTDSDPGLEITLNLALIKTDLDNIKLNGELAVDVGTSYLWFKEGFISDMADYPNQIERLWDDTSSQPKQASSYTADVTVPVLESFDYDKATGVLELHYSEAMEASSLRGELLRLQGTSDGTGNSVDLRGGSFHHKDDTTLTYTLSNAKLSAVQALSDVAASQATTYLAAGVGHAQDMAGNNVTSVPRSDAMLLGPALQRFTLDMNTGTLSLFFPEAMDQSAFNLSAITFVDDDSDRYPSGAMYVPVDANRTHTTMMKDDKIVEVSLSTDDVNGIKLVTDLCT